MSFKLSDHVAPSVMRMLPVTTTVLGGALVVVVNIELDGVTKDEDGVGDINAVPVEDMVMTEEAEMVSVEISVVLSTNVEVKTLVSEGKISEDSKDDVIMLYDVINSDVINSEVIIKNEVSGDIEGEKADVVYILDVSVGIDGVIDTDDVTDVLGRTDDVMAADEKEGMIVDIAVSNISEDNIVVMGDGETIKDVVLCVIETLSVALTEETADVKSEVTAGINVVYDDVILTCDVVTEVICTDAVTFTGGINDDISLVYNDVVPMGEDIITEDIIDDVISDVIVGRIVSVLVSFEIALDETFFAAVIIVELSIIVDVGINVVVVLGETNICVSDVTIDDFVIKGLDVDSCDDVIETTGDDVMSGTSAVITDDETAGDDVTMASEDDVIDDVFDVDIVDTEDDAITLKVGAYEEVIADGVTDELSCPIEFETLFSSTVRSPNSSFMAARFTTS